MARVFIIGATGGIGSRLAAQLIEWGVHPIGLHRRPEQAQILQANGIEPVQGDLTSLGVDELANHLKGVDAIVFAAGASSAGTRQADAVDGQGVVLTTAAAKVANVRRYLHISAFPDAWRDRHMSSEFEHYMKVKRQADVHIVDSDMDWVIVRPGTLTSSQGTGLVRLGLAIPYGEVPRDDVASVLAELIHRPELNRIILELTTGEIPIHEALNRVI